MTATDSPQDLGRVLAMASRLDAVCASAIDEGVPAGEAFAGAMMSFARTCCLFGERENDDKTRAPLSFEDVCKLLAPIFEFTAAVTKAAREKWGELDDGARERALAELRTRMDDAA